MKKQEITNVMRICAQRKAAFVPHYYDTQEAVSGDVVAEMIGEDPAHVFKTLVTAGKSGKNYVFVIPVLQALDLKKAASAAGEKNIEMLKSKELLPLTGYVHGGCSPIGMKKFFRTFFDESAKSLDTVVFSAGKIGAQIEITAKELEKVIEFGYADLCM